MKGPRPENFDAVFDEEYGLWVRPQCDDIAIVKECRRYYAAVPVPAGATVLDLGAHIGAGIPIWWGKGAGRCIAVEPEPRNVDLLEQNAAQFSLYTTVMAAAVVGGDGMSSVQFYVTDGKGQWGHGLRKNPNRSRAVTVMAIGLSRLLSEYAPTVLKCDIEGGEYGLPELHNLPGYVRALALEVHVGALDSEWRSLGRHLLASIGDQGFQPVKVGRESKAATINGVWAR